MVTQVKPQFSKTRDSIYDRESLIRCSTGELFGDGFARLPAPPLLMLDSVSCLNPFGGKYNRGYAEGNKDIQACDWIFKSHFTDSPLMPGSLLLESIWQLAGVYVAHFGYKGQCRVINSGEAEFQREIVPGDECCELHVNTHVKRIKRVGVKGKTQKFDSEIYIF